MISGIKILMKGNFISKAIVVLMIPVIARLYTPNEIGVAALFTSCLLIISPLLNLRYCLAIPLPRRREVVELLIWVCLIFTFITTFLLSVIFLLSSKSVFALFGVEEIYDLKFLLAISCLIVSVYEVFNMWIVRRKKFKNFSNVIIKQSIFGSIVKICGGLWSGPLGLILGTIVQNSFGLYSFVSSYIEEKKGSFKLNIQLLLFTVKYYANYFYFKLPAHLLFAVSAQMPIIYASKYFSMSDVGYLSLAISMVALPIGAISRSINKVYYSEVSSIGKNKPEEIYNVTIKLVKKLLLLGVLVSSITFVLSPWVFSFILGESWNDSGEYARALSIGLIFQISATTVIMVLNVINLNAFSFFMHLLRFLVISFSFYISYIQSYSLVDSIYAYSLSISLFYLFVIISIILILKKNVLKSGEVK